MLPNQKDIEVPLLEVLVELGGQAKAKEVYPLVTKKFPKITEDDLAEVIQSGASKWINRIQWVRMRLIDKGEMDSPSRGVWGITDKGRKRIETNESPEETSVNFLSYMMNMKQGSVHNCLINCMNLLHASLKSFHVSCFRLTGLLKSM